MGNNDNYLLVISLEHRLKAISTCTNYIYIVALMNKTSIFTSKSFYRQDQRRKCV